jgi:hypothetical protein
MKKYYLYIALVVLLSACDSSDNQQVTPESKVQEPAAVQMDKATLEEIAKEAIQALGSTLKNELETAMKSGGPINALEVCNVKAPVIAEEISWEQDVQVSRTSLKYRNPANAPNEWQTTVLEDFEAKKAVGADPATLVYSEIVNNEFRFMKAIPTAGLCLACHGTDISPEVTAELARLYPQDKATGFKEGDLRGAFVVVKNLAE